MIARRPRKSTGALSAGTTREREEISLWTLQFRSKQLERDLYKSELESNRKFFLVVAAVVLVLALSAFLFWSDDHLGQRLSPVVGVWALVVGTVAAVPGLRGVFDRHATVLATVLVAVVGAWGCVHVYVRSSQGGCLHEASRTNMLLMLSTIPFIPFVPFTVITVVQVVTAAIYLASDITYQSRLDDGSDFEAGIYTVAYLVGYLAISAERHYRRRLVFLQRAVLQHENLEVSLPVTSGKQRNRVVPAEPGSMSLVDPAALAMEQIVGRGAFGVTFRASWKGTLVAVKKLHVERMPEGQIDEIRDEFVQELKLMASLRHPNVVLFMGACLEPELLLLMEFMARGSLFDMLHKRKLNPTPAFAQMALLSTAKGTAFLHSLDPPIVHKDLKTANILIDENWTVKISDFGTSVIKGRGQESSRPGTLPYSAPEVLERNPSTEKSDVYSFGILAWEVLAHDLPFRRQVVGGSSALSLIVTVVRERKRPDIEKILIGRDLYGSLIEECWRQDPERRPSMSEVQDRLTALGSQFNEDPLATGVEAGSFVVPSSKTGSRLGPQKARRGPAEGSWTAPGKVFGAGSATESESPSMSQLVKAPAGPTGTVAIVLTEIEQGLDLWESKPHVMRESVELSNEVFRELLKLYDGYEVKAEAGAFFVVFASVSDALLFSAKIETAMTSVPWPTELLEHPACAPETDELDLLLSRGLRHQIGIHRGLPLHEIDGLSGRTTYFGSSVQVAAQVLSFCARDHAVMASESVQVAVAAMDTPVQSIQFAKFDTDEVEYAVYVVESDDGPSSGTGPRRASARVPDAAGEAAGDKGDGEVSKLRRKTRPSQMLSKVRRNSRRGSGVAIKAVNGELYASDDDADLHGRESKMTIDPDDLDFGDSLGFGSYGQVFVGRYRGRNVTIKTLLEQMLSEKTRLRFFEEACVMRWLSHPNVVRLVGACLAPPHQCLVFEYHQYSLRELLNTESRGAMIKEKREHLALGIARGMEYVHGNDIKHRNLKSNNVLLNDDWVPVIADFGMAQVKQETFTHAQGHGGPWLAPEILRGESYTLESDVYSFAIVMWEIWTTQIPFKGVDPLVLPGMVVDGQRPELPEGANDPAHAIIKASWNADPESRPSFTMIGLRLEQLV